MRAVTSWFAIKTELLEAFSAEASANSPMVPLLCRWGEGDINFYGFFAINGSICPGFERIRVRV